MIKKLFEKMIDKIIAKKLMNYIRRSLAIYRHNYKIIKLKDSYQYKVKHYRLPEDDKFYEVLIEIPYKDSLERFVAIIFDISPLIDILKRTLDEQIKRFVEP